MEVLLAERAPSKTVTSSTTESEYIAASKAAKDAVWIRKFITGLGVVPSILDLIEHHCDNNGAIAQAKEPRSHQKIQTHTQEIPSQSRDRRERRCEDMQDSWREQRS